jgi:hypothetical protein
MHLRFVAVSAALAVIGCSNDDSEMASTGHTATTSTGDATGALDESSSSEGDTSGDTEDRVVPLPPSMHAAFDSPV